MPAPPLPEKRRVLHLIRTYLRQTETFVPSQMVSARRYRTWVLARNDLKGETEQFPVPGLSVYTRDRSRWSAFNPWADVNYQVLKRMSTAEQRFYVKHVRRIQPELIHIHYGPDAYYFLPVLEAAGVPGRAL